LLNEIQDYDDLFRLGATAEDLAQLPKEDYGKSSKPGVFRLLLHLLGKEKAESFETYITVEKLKNFKTLAEFIKCMKDLNDELATQAIILNRVETRLKPAKPLGLETNKSDAREESDRTAPKNSEKSYPFKRNNLRLMSSESKKALRQTLEEEDPYEYEIAAALAPDSDEDGDTPESDPLTDDVVQDDSPVLFQFQRPSNNSRPVVKAPVNGPRRESKPKTLPCFTQFYESNCSNRDCSYSHDPILLAQHGKELLAKLKKSPYMKESFGKVSILTKPKDDNV